MRGCGPLRRSSTASRCAATRTPAGSHSSPRIRPVSPTRSSAAHGEHHCELRQEKYETNDAHEVAQLVRKVLDGDEPDGTSCFGHSLVALDGNGKPLTPILGWRDTRSADAAEWLCRRLDTEAVHARTGAFLHPSFWPAKL